MKLLTEVSLPDYPFILNHQSRVLMMGSCFTENIGRLMERYLFPVNINPFGVTYNPLSVKRGLEALMHKDAYGEGDLDRHRDLWFSFDHSTRFSSPDPEMALASINQDFQEAKKYLREAEYLILTWGTSWVFSHKASAKVVCNCHKIPASEFVRKRLSTKEIIAAYEELLPELFEYNKNLKILYTVSPVRHWKDGAHGNQLSKASLLLAGDALEQKFPEKLFYFPSYEILMDELRDYRFYAKDMLHTSEQSTRYIWGKFQDAFMEKQTGEIINEAEVIRKILEHRPLSTGKDAEKEKEIRISEKLEVAGNKYPEVDWERLYKSEL
jgi:hypothetical protein